MIQHYDQNMRDHRKAGRHTAREVLEHSKTQSYDVSLRAYVGRNEYVKRFAVELTDSPNRPLLVVKDSVPGTGIFMQKRIKPESRHDDIFKEAYDMAGEMQDNWYQGLLLENGFRPD